MLYQPQVAVWETTFMCNVNCIHCGSGCESSKRADELNTQEAVGLIEQLADLGLSRITLAGGEPFMRKDWPILAHKIKQLGMDFSVISNGYLVNPEIVALLVKLQPKTIGISLDGGDALLHDYIRGRKGCFENALRAIDMLLDAGLNTSVVTCLQRINFNHLEKIKQIILLYGLDSWQIQVATPQGRMDIRFAITERQFYETSKFIAANNARYKNTYITGADSFGYYGALGDILHPSDWKGCHAGMGVIGLESNGNVKGCLSLPGDRFVEGNIKQKSLREIWEDPNAFSYNRHFCSDMLGGFCKECLYGSICRGGCTERSYGFASNVCENSLCLYKFQVKGFSNELQASLNPEPEETQKAYNSVSPLPEGLSLVNPVH